MNFLSYFVSSQNIHQQNYLKTFNQNQRKIRQRLLAASPGQLVVQITDKCNAICPQCGMRATSDFKRFSIEKNDVLRIIDAAARLKIKAISFTGGEPLLALDDLCAYINYAGEKNISFIRTGTNGFQFTGSEKPGFRQKVGRIAEKLSRTPLRNFWISMDSIDSKIHEQMRGFEGVVQGIRKALPIFEDTGIFPSVNLGINRNVGGSLTRNLDARDFSDTKAFENAVYTTYKRAFSMFYDLALDLGFTIVNACYPMSVDETMQDLDAVYSASAVDSIVRFSPLEKKNIFKALRDTIPVYRGKIRIFSPLSSLNSLVKDYSGKGLSSSPCQGGINYFFIDAKTCTTYPCGFRGHESYGKFWDLNGSFKYRQETMPDCRQCDWECFRDPSELQSPFADLLTTPLNLFRKLLKDKAHYRMWLNDLLYYQACGYFNGRKAPDKAKMSRFAVL